MGRSVDYLNHAIHIAYVNLDLFSISCQYCGSTDVSELETDYDGNNHQCNNCNKLFEGYESDPEIEWDFLMDAIEEILRERVPSITIFNRKQSKWEGNEVRIFAENNLAEFGISEYCGLVSISVRVIEDDYSYKYESLARNWINKTWPGIQSLITKRFPDSTLRRIGGFSNGESVYELIKQ